MNTPGSAREALIAEAIGDLGLLIDRAEALRIAMAQSRQSLVDAHAQLADQLAAFEAHVTALTERAKVLAVKHILARTEEAARRSIEEQSRAMADAARVAFGAELGAMMQRLQSALQPLIERRERRWDSWLTHAAVAAAASILTWALTAWPWAR